MAFFNIYVAAVPKANKQAIIDHATQVATVFKEKGALDYLENWGVDVPEGDVTSFSKAVNRAEDEDIIVGWVKWPSKQVADAAWPDIMQDPLMQPDTNAMPFDGKRMIFGGFETVVEA